MTLPNDIARCLQHNCPAKDRCLRFLLRDKIGQRTTYFAPQDFTDKGCALIIEEGK